MAEVVLGKKAQSDFERLFEFLAVENLRWAVEATKVISDGLKILESHPLVGRLLESGLRELVISRGRSGYVALYVYEEINDAVTVLAIRHQRESGYN